VSRSGRCVSILAGLTAITLLALEKQATHLFSVPDRGDPLFSMWRIGWVQHQLPADPRHLFDANIFYPLRATLTYSDAMLLPALTAWPLAGVGLHPVVVYNVLLLLSFVLSGFGVYLLVRALEWGTAAAWFSAVAFMLTPFRMNHFSHLELQMTMWMPLMLVGIIRLVQTGRPVYVAGIAVSLAAQWYSSMYYGLFLTVYSLAFAATMGCAGTIPVRRAALVVAAYVMAAAVVLPLGWEYVQSQPARGVRQAESIREFSAVPTDYLTPGVATPAYRQWLPRVATAERALFPGILPLLLLIPAMWPPWSAPRAAFVVAGLVAFDGSLGLNGVLYPALYKAAFPFQSIRVPARFGMLVMLSVAVLGGYGASRLISWFKTSSVRRASAAVLTALLMIDGWPRYDSLPMWKSPPSIYESLPGSAVLFEFPVHPPPDRFAENLPYMYFSMWHWRPMVNGYSGFNPREYAAMLDGTQGFPAPPALDFLRRLGVTHLTVHCRLWEPEVCAATTADLDRRERVRLVARADWYGAPSSLYELRP
jgi:hypothetical protein